MFILFLILGPLGSQFRSWSFRSWSLGSSHYAVQSHSRLSILVQIESSYATSY